MSRLPELEKELSPSSTDIACGGRRTDCMELAHRVMYLYVYMYLYVKIFLCMNMNYTNGIETHPEPIAPRDG